MTYPGSTGFEYCICTPQPWQIRSDWERVSSKLPSLVKGKESGEGEEEKGLRFECENKK